MLKLLRIKKEIISEKERNHLELELRYVMTGLEQTKAIFEKESAGATFTNKKKALTTKKRKTQCSLALNQSRKKIKS